MNVTLKTASCVSVSLAVLLGLSVYAFRSQPLSAKQQLARQEIAQPAKWVAFSADYRNSLGALAATGKYYRDANGSTRSEITSPDGSQTSINIQNLPARMTWLKNPSTGEWRGKSMPDLPQEPRRYSTAMVGLSSQPEVATTQGLQVYKLQDPASGETRLLAPALNFFALVVESRDGARREYTNIRFENPPSELFEPPPGVPVTVVESFRELFGAPGAPAGRPDSAPAR